MRALTTLALACAVSVPAIAQEQREAISQLIKGWDACLMQAIGPARASGLAGPMAAEAALASCATEEQAFTMFLAQIGSPPTWAAIARVRLKQKLVSLGTPASVPPRPKPNIYIHDLVKRNKAILRTWSAIVPDRFREIKWISRLDGTTIPIRYVERGEGRFAVGTVCEPHNCMGNTVAFAISEDGMRAFGLLNAKDISDGIQLMGSPSGPMSDVLFDALEGKAR